MMMIDDLHIEYHWETSTIYFIVELLNGKEITICESLVDDEPTFAKENVNVEYSDYEYYYNLCLQEAQKQGYLLVGNSK